MGAEKAPKRCRRVWDTAAWGPATRQRVAHEGLSGNVRATTGSGEQGRLLGSPGRWPPSLLECNPASRSPHQSRTGSGRGALAVVQAQDSGQRGQGAAGWHRPDGHRPLGVSGVWGAWGSTACPGSVCFGCWEEVRPGARQEEHRALSALTKPLCVAQGVSGGGLACGQEQRSQHLHRGHRQAFPPGTRPALPTPWGLEPARLSLAGSPSPLSWEKRTPCPVSWGRSCRWSPACLCRKQELRWTVLAFGDQDV